MPGGYFFRYKSYIAVLARPARSAAPYGILRMSKQAIVKKSPYKDIWVLAWPQVLMMVFHFLVGFVDVYVAGRIHSNVQAALGPITQSLFFFLIIAIATANGSVAAISQSLGAGNELRAMRYVGLSLVLGLIAGAAIFIFGVFSRGAFLSLLQVPGEIYPVAEYFLGVYLLILPVYYIFIIGNAIFRAQRQVHIPLFSMMILTAANTVGDFGLGLGMWGLPNLGYKGLAWSTFFAVACGAAFNLGVLRRRGWLCRACLPPLRWVKSALPYLVKVAWPAGAMQILWQTGYLVLYAITAGLPRGNISALAGMTAGIRIESLLFLPAFALNFTSSILIGHLLGAGDEEEARRMGRRIWLTGAAAVTVLGLAVWAYKEELAAFLAPDPGVAAEVVNYLVYNLIAIPFTATGMILGGAYVGAGATIYNMMIMGISAWLVRLPLAYTLGHLVFGRATGVWLAMMLSMMFMAGFSVYIYHFKDWTRFSMRRQKIKGVLNAPRI